MYALMCLYHFEAKDHIPLPQNLCFYLYRLLIDYHIRISSQKLSRNIESNLLKVKVCLLFDQEDLRQVDVFFFFSCIMGHVGLLLLLPLVLGKFLLGQCGC